MNRGRQVFLSRPPRSFTTCAARARADFFVLKEEKCPSLLLLGRLMQMCGACRRLHHGGDGFLSRPSLMTQQQQQRTAGRLLLLLPASEILLLVR